MKSPEKTPEEIAEAIDCGEMLAEYLKYGPDED